MSGTNGKPPGGDRRRFFRVPARLPIRVCALDPSEAEAISLEITTAASDPPEIEDPAIAAAMGRIEGKLDRILDFLGSNRTEPLTSEHAHWISISGGGVGLPGEAAVEGDGPILVELELPETPARKIRAVSHVVRSPRSAQSRRSAKSLNPFALSFDVIAPADQEAIIRYSYEVQRIQLRERSEELSPSL